MSDVTMQDAIDAGDGTLHGAIDYWQTRCAELEEKLKLAETAINASVGWVFAYGESDTVELVRSALAKIKEES